MRLPVRRSCTALALASHGVCVQQEQPQEQEQQEQAQPQEQEQWQERQERQVSRYKQLINVWIVQLTELELYFSTGLELIMF